ncbi:hypothetical protein J6595_08635 [Jiella sp. KSK16Y-1]|uniref:Uncharacterized protein n=1 Tax=Jiella mangrovi TaxID=2821407 RepID=A0ABS4BFV5_9HYPH|nr:hypothetical protein [Jiella mangrovi]
MDKTASVAAGIAGRAAPVSAMALPVISPAVTTGRFGGPSGCDGRRAEEC